MFKLSIDKDDGKTKIRNLVWMFAYQLRGNETIKPNAGEDVDSVEWLSFDNCLALAKEGKTAVSEEVVGKNLRAIVNQNHDK
jgi:hypothetical protein